MHTLHHEFIIADMGAQQLASALAVNKRLQKLVLYENGIREIGCLALCQVREQGRGDGR